MTVQDLLHADSAKAVFRQIALIEHLNNLGSVLVLRSVIVESKLVIELLGFLCFHVMVLGIEGIFSHFFFGGRVHISTCSRYPVVEIYISIE
jgi:hypothetical protein